MLNLENMHINQCPPPPPPLKKIMKCISDNESTLLRWKNVLLNNESHYMGYDDDDWNAD